MQAVGLALAEVAEVSGLKDLELAWVAVVVTVEIGPVMTPSR